jgi:hypothetical protein
MKKRPGNHSARRAAAMAEPSPITALRDMLATSYAADVAAVTPEVCEVLRQQMNVLATAAQRDGIRTALVRLARNPEELAIEVAEAFRARFDMKVIPGDDPFSKTSRLSTSGLAQADDTLLKIDLALDQCSARLREQTAAEVFHLTARVAQMVGRDDLEEPENPIVPRVLARALIEALGKMGFDDEQRLAIFKAFGPALLHIAPDLYAHANSLLVEMGVMANFNARYGRPVIRHAAPAQAAPSTAADERVMAALLERLLKGREAIHK